MGRFRSILVATVLLVLPSSSALANPHLQRAKRSLDAFQEHKALRELRRAARWPRNTSKLRAEVHLYRGIAYFNLLRRAQARRAFAEALKLDRSVVLPASVSPKITSLFQEVKAALAPEPTPPPGDPAPPGGEGGEPELFQEGKPQDARPPANQAADDQRLDDDGRDGPGLTGPRWAKDPGPRSSPTNWPAWITLGVATAVGGAGVGFGFWARAAQHQAADLGQPWYAAEIHQANASDRALVTNFLCGIAGAAAVTSGVLFILGRSSRGDSDVRASATVTPAGGVLVTSGATW